MQKTSAVRLAGVVLPVAVVVALLAPSPATFASTGSAIRFGMLGPFTGFEADLGAAIAQGSRAAQREVNDGGGVLGRELQLVAGDTEGGSGLAAVRAINHLIDYNHVVAIIGPEDMEYQAVRPIFTRAQIPTIVQGGDVTLDHETDPFFWRNSPSDSVMTVAMVLYARRQGYTRAAMMMVTEHSAQTMRAPLAAAFERLGGKVVADVTVQSGQTSYRSEVLKVIRARPDVVFSETDAPTAAVIFTNFRELDNFAIPFIGTDLTAGDDYLEAVTYKTAHDHLVSVVGASAQGGQAFEESYHRVYPRREPPANAVFAYDAVISVALAADRAGSTDPPKINAAMMTVTNPPGTTCHRYAVCLALLRAGTKIDYEGATGSLGYNKHHNTFGPFEVVRVDLQGHPHRIAFMSASELAEATP